MSLLQNEPTIAEWDTNHFGFVIGKFDPKNVDSMKIFHEWAKRNNVKMAISRCGTANIPVMIAMQREGFILLDAYIRYRFEYKKRTISAPKGRAYVRLFKSDDLIHIERIAALSFHNYIGHFHNDPNLDQEKCDSLYAKWALNGCLDKNVADEVLVAEVDSKIAGFALLKDLGNNIGEWILGGVDPEMQGRGVYYDLIIGVLQWFRNMKFDTMEIDSQINNYGVQRVWHRLGFDIYDSGFTFHWWQK